MSAMDVEDSVKEPLAPIVDWEGPEENPQNWSTLVKCFHLYVLAGTSFLATFASSVQVPVTNDIENELSFGTELGTLAYCIYVLGFAFGAPLAGPISETFGRRAVAWFSFPLFTLFVLGCGFSNNITALCCLRFLAGVFGAPNLSVGGGIIADLWLPEQRGIPMAIFTMSPFLGPALGPLIGGTITLGLSWRWSAWLVLFASIVAFYIPAPFLRESYKKTILQRRAKKLGVPGPPGMAEGMSTFQTVRVFATIQLMRPFHMFFTEPIITAFVLYVSFNFALLYAFFAAFPYVFRVYYGFDRFTVGLTFMGVGAGVLIGTVLIVMVDRMWYLPRAKAAAQVRPGNGNFASKLPPEKRLPIAMFGGPLITAGLFIFGWSSAARVHWIAPVIGEAMFGCGNLLVFVSSLTYLMDVYGALYGASALGSNSLVRYIMGFIFPLFALQMFTNLKVQWACTLLGCISAVGMLIPFALYRWGPFLRTKTRYPKDN